MLDVNQYPDYKLESLRGHFDFSTVKGGKIVVSLEDIDSLEVEDISLLESLYTEALHSDIHIYLKVDKSSTLSTQIDFDRLHRKFTVLYNGEVENIDPLMPVLFDEDELAHIPQAWREDTSRIVQQIESASHVDALFLFKWILANEQFLYSKNLISPYMDIIPKIIQQIDENKFTFIVESLSVGHIIKIFFEDYTLLPDHKIASIFSRLNLDLLNKVFQKMSMGVDLPKRTGSILCFLNSKVKQEILNHLSCLSVLKIFKYADSLATIDKLILCMSKDKLIELTIFIEQSDLLNKSEINSYLDYVSTHDLGFTGQTNYNESTYDYELLWRDIDIKVFDKLFYIFSGQGQQIVENHGHYQIKQIQESIDYIYGRKRVNIDLVEFKATDYEAFCYKSEDLTYSYTDFLKVLEQNNGVSNNDLFKKLGLFQLSNKAKEKNIDIAINGNFYFDYGHYLYGNKLNLPLEKSCGLNFGDPVGLLVSNYETLSPATYNRASFIIDSEGKPYIRRFKLQEVNINGEHLSWSAENLNEPSTNDDCVFYNNVFGFNTPQISDRVSLVIANGAIQKVVEGGGAFIPFTGFVLSLTRKYWGQFKEGDRVQFNNTIHSKKIKEAIGCGPLLLKDGEIDIDFNKEDFGQQDSSVMSFFLPRQFEKYEAARSFIGLRGDKIVLGTISGCSYGTGLQDVSTGMTFSELAMFCKDIKLDYAMGLDGGGSSSVVTRQQQVHKILNTPTGGKDVPRGTERFISTAIMFKYGK